MNRRRSSLAALVRSDDHEAPQDAGRPERPGFDGCVYPDALLMWRIGALADRTWLTVCGSRRW